MRESSDPRYAPASFPRYHNLHCSAIFPFLLRSFLVSSCSGSVNWIYPSKEEEGNSLVFNYIDTVYFTWTSNITDPYMNLWCSHTPSGPQTSTYSKTHPALRDPPHPFSIIREKYPHQEIQLLKMRPTIYYTTSKSQPMAQALSHSHTAIITMVAFVTCKLWTVPDMILSTPRCSQ